MRKILVVEDDPMLSEIYQRKLMQVGYEVSVAASGTQAEEKARKEHPELMLLDLVLPEEDGFDVLKKVKEDKDTKDIRVIIFSNLSQEEDKEKAKELGADGFIAKSDYTPQQIVEQIRKILNEDSEEQPSPQIKQKRAAFRSKKNLPLVTQKILIVEDEEVFTEVFGRKLETEGYQVELAKNGAWGIEKINNQKYDLILLDILMPEMNGMEVLHHTKENGPNTDTPILVLSNSIDEEKVHEIIEAGANDVIIKTRVTPSELVLRIKEVMA